MFSGISWITLRHTGTVPGLRSGWDKQFGKMTWYRTVKLQPRSEQDFIPCWDMSRAKLRRFVWFAQGRHYFKQCPQAGSSLPGLEDGHATSRTVHATQRVVPLAFLKWIRDGSWQFWVTYMTALGLSTFRAFRISSAGRIQQSESGVRGLEHQFKCVMIYKMINIKPPVNVQGIVQIDFWWHRLLTKYRD